MTSPPRGGDGVRMDQSPLCGLRSILTGFSTIGRTVWQYARPAVRRDLRDRSNLRRLIAWTVPADGHCIDIGAHAGDVLEDLLVAAPAGRHLAFEPLPELAEALRARFPSVEVRGEALSDTPGEREFTRVVGNPGWSGFRERPTPDAERFERLHVQAVRLDEVLPEGFAPTFVKLDVEGAELEALRGALETLRRSRPTLAFEHGLGSADHYDTRPGDVFDLLTGPAGMRIFDLHGGAPYDLTRFRAAFDAGRTVNFVAHA